MTTTNFIDKQTVIVADWLNDVDAHVYDQETTAHQATKINFNLNETGSINRTVKEKLGDVVSVKDFGAVGDGVTDDTVAIQNFVNSIKGSGRKGYIPTGRYVLTSRITIDESCEIYGDGWQDVRDYTGPTTRDWTQAITRGTIIYLSYTAASDSYGFYITGNSVTIRDIEFETNQGDPDSIGWTPTQAPWAIYCYRQPYYEYGGNNVIIKNIMLRNCTHGIAMDGVSGGRIDGIFGQVLNTGISVTKNYDVLRINNVHFNWHFWSGKSNVISYIKQNSQALQLGKVDNPMLSNIFVFQGRIGLHLYTDTDPLLGGFTERLHGTNFGFDDIVEGIVCHDSATLDISNLYVYCDSTVVNSRAIHCEPLLTGVRPVKLNITNADFQGSYSEAIILYSPGNVSLSNVRIRSWNLSSTGKAAIRTDSATVSISNIQADTTQSNGGAVLIENSPGTISGYYDTTNGNAFTVRTYTGTCNGAGEADITHGITNLQLYGLFAQGWYKAAGDGAMLPLTPVYLAPPSMKFSGGVSGAAYRVNIIYSPTIIGSW